MIIKGLVNTRTYIHIIVISITIVAIVYAIFIVVVIQAIIFMIIIYIHVPDDAVARIIAMVFITVGIMIQKRVCARVGVSVK